jgi:hypothetical protein
MQAKVFRYRRLNRIANTRTKIEAALAVITPATGKNSSNGMPPICAKIMIA